MKEIEQMNIEELRSALRESEEARIKAENNFKAADDDRQKYLKWWQDAEENVKTLEAKFAAVKSIVAVM